MGQGLFYQHFAGHIIEHVGGIVDDPVLAVGGKWVQGNVGDDAELRDRFLQCRHCPLHKSIRVVGLFGQQALAVCANNRKQGQGGNTQRLYFPRLFDQQVYAKALDAGHGGDLLALALTLQNKDRENQVSRG